MVTGFPLSIHYTTMEVETSMIIPCIQSQDCSLLSFWKQICLEWNPYRIYSVIYQPTNISYQVVLLISLLISLLHSSHINQYKLYLMGQCALDWHHPNTRPNWHHLPFNGELFLVFGQLQISKRPNSSWRQLHLWWSCGHCLGAP